MQFIVWSIFGDFLLMTPFAALFYRLMGAKLGLNVQINSKYCADLSLLEIGEQRRNVSCALQRSSRAGSDGAAKFFRHHVCQRSLA